MFQIRLYTIHMLINYRYFDNVWVRFSNKYVFRNYVMHWWERVSKKRCESNLVKILTFSQLVYFSVISDVQHFYYVYTLGLKTQQHRAHDNLNSVYRISGGAVVNHVMLSIRYTLPQLTLVNSFPLLATAGRAAVDWSSSMGERVRLSVEHTHHWRGHRGGCLLAAHRHCRTHRSNTPPPSHAFLCILLHHCPDSQFYWWLLNQLD